MLDGPINVRQKFIINSFANNNDKRLNIKIFKIKNLGIV